MTRLEFCREELRRKQEERAIPADDLEDLEKKVDKLKEALLASELSPELKWALLDALDAIKRAIILYRIEGAEGLRQAWAQNIGTLVQYKDIFKEEVDESKKKQYWDLFSKIATLLSFARNVNTLTDGTERVKELLLPLIGS